VSDASRREGGASWLDDASVHDPHRPIEPRDQDREPHPEGVDRRGLREPHRLAGRESVSTAQAAGPLPPRRRNLASERDVAGTAEDDLEHRATLAVGTDASSAVPDVDRATEAA
jgi:hypothetical protein